ncbi:MAG: hypothetical protein NT038_07410 [Euryarchaeota archaeon]|nr:hypothetical protein [Euryarchaeota archaeon]
MGTNSRFSAGDPLFVRDSSIQHVGTQENSEAGINNIVFINHTEKKILSEPQKNNQRRKI